METFNAFLETTVMGIEVWRVILFFLVILVAMVAGRLVRWFLGRAANQSASSGRTIGSLVIKSLSKPALFLVLTMGIWLAFGFLGLQGEGATMVATVINVLYAAVIGYALYSLVDVMDHYLGEWVKKTESKMDDMLVPLIGKSIRLTILVLVILQIAQALSDKPITAILASLGVGGLALALAGQETVKNFFGSLVILADKPFEIGDRVIIDGHEGPVEHVGFRSTRIRTTNSHLITVPNSEIVVKTVLNKGKGVFRKYSTTIGITYDTTPEKVLRATEIIKDILKDHDGMKPNYPPLVGFAEFGPTYLGIAVTAFYHSYKYKEQKIDPSDFLRREMLKEGEFGGFVQKVNLEILKRFNAEGIEFAFPTQTLYLAGDPKRRLSLDVHDQD